MKARLDEVIGTFAAQPETSPQIWDRLLSAVVVQPFTPQDNTMLGPSIHYDITYQLQEIEVTLSVNVQWWLSYHVILCLIRRQRDAFCGNMLHSTRMMDNHSH